MTPITIFCFPIQIMAKVLKRKPIPPDIKRSEYNNNNLHEYDPYILSSESKIIVDKTWYLNLPRQVQSLIIDRLGDNIQLGIVEVPHPVSPDTPSKLLTTVYQSYLDGFDYDQWYHRGIPNGPKDVSMLYIDNTTKKILAEMYENKSIEDQRLDQFKGLINSRLQRNKKYFIRLSSTSGKNTKSIEPLRTSEDIIRRLVTNQEFYEREYTRDKDTSLILIPWNPKIEKRYEFRIFVKDGVLTGASQQWWSQLFNYTAKELENIETALNNINSIEYLRWIPYKTFVGDVYIDGDVCYLIECNPFGAHCGAGSSLFNWITDYDILHGNSGCSELRYLSVIDY